MHLSIAAFHARFTAQNDDPVMAPLRLLRQLAHLRQADEAKPLALWTIWGGFEEPIAAASATAPA